ncbi:MAG: DNA-binding domain-containing protein [Steroidobacteraceae bacterium]
MNNLRGLQLAMQEHVLHGGPAIVAGVRQSSGLDAPGRLAIYASAYTLRLTAALRESYPALLHVMGPSEFDAMARTYVEAQPSHHASIRWFGGQLADHLQTRGSDALADIARWEWALGTVFDGPDTEPVGLDAVNAFTVGGWPVLRIVFCRNLQRIAVCADAVQAWRTATSGTSDSPTDTRSVKLEWLVWRRDLATTFRSLLPDESWAFDAARHGATFGELCEGLATRVGEESAPARAASLLKQWLTDGCVAALTCAPPPPGGTSCRLKEPAPTSIDRGLARMNRRPVRLVSARPSFVWDHGSRLENPADRLPLDDRRHAADGRGRGSRCGRGTHSAHGAAPRAGRAAG